MRIREEENTVTCPHSPKSSNAITEALACEQIISRSFCRHAASVAICNPLEVRK